MSLPCRCCLLVLDAGCASRASCVPVAGAPVLRWRAGGRQRLDQRPACPSADPWADAFVQSRLTESRGPVGAVVMVRLRSSVGALRRDLVQMVAGVIVHLVGCPAGGVQCSEARPMPLVAVATFKVRPGAHSALNAKALVIGGARPKRLFVG